MFRTSLKRIQRVLSSRNLTVAHQPNNATRKVFSDLQPKNETNYQRSLVYEMECNECVGTFIGQTKQHLSKGISDD